MSFKLRVFFPWESDFGDEAILAGGQDVWRPPADIFETENFFYIAMELPGVEKEDIEIDIIGERLEIKGERRFEKRVGEFKIIKSEVPYGFFLRTFKLPPDIERERVEAYLERGVLMIKIPKRTITVNVEGE